MHAFMFPRSDRFTSNTIPSMDYPMTLKKISKFLGTLAFASCAMSAQALHLNSGGLIYDGGTLFVENLDSDSGYGMASIWTRASQLLASSCFSMAKEVRRVSASPSSPVMESFPVRNWSSSSRLRTTSCHGFQIPSWRKSPDRPTHGTGLLSKTSGLGLIAISTTRSSG